MAGLGEEQPALDHRARAGARRAEKRRRPGEQRRAFDLRRRERGRQRRGEQQQEGPAPELARVLARDAVDHLLGDEGGPVRRRVEQPDPAQPPEPGRALGGGRPGRRVDEAPVSALEVEGEERRHHDDHRRVGARAAEQDDQRVDPERPREQRQREIIGHHPAVVPGRDRAQRGVDHARRVDRKPAQQRGRQPGGADRRRLPVAEDPPRCEDQRREVGRRRQHALARQPGRAPLRIGLERAFRVAEMEGRRDEAEAHQPEGERERRGREPRAGRDDGARGQQAQQRQHPVPGPRGHGEEDDRIRRAHPGPSATAGRRASGGSGSPLRAVAGRRAGRRAARPRRGGAAADIC